MKNKKNIIMENLESIAIAVLFELIVVGSIFCLISSIDKDIENSKKYYLTQTVKIKSLETSNTTEWHFLLGWGSMRNRTMYYVYVQNKDGGFKLENYPTDETIIYEISDDKQSCLEIYENKTKSMEKYKLYVPKGTIKTEYNAMLGK